MNTISIDVDNSKDVLIGFLRKELTAERRKNKRLVKYLDIKIRELKALKTKLKNAKTN